MKKSQICAVVLLLVVGSVMAFADGINDPKVIIHGVNGDLPQHCGPNGCQNVGVNFSFSSPKGGSGTLFFTNASGKNWTSLALIESGEPAADISCVQTLFLNCSVTTLTSGKDKGDVEILLSGVRGGLNPRVGILAGQSFSITFNCAGGCWPKTPITFNGHATTAVPEPGTVALMVTGLGTLFSRRKLWKGRLSA
ncbi:MAG: PEP-CTERM sorting domain-containing protein [Terriglobales bacterium]|jgi:hypothetical protein